VHMIDRVFRSRSTGKITVVQVPNAALAVALVAWLLHRLLGPSGSINTPLTVLGTVALVVWAADEIIRGVNPWRRFLGGGVLVWQVVSLAFR
jgi:hypothetical protein